MIKKALAIGLFSLLTGCATVSNTHVEAQNSFQAYHTLKSDVIKAWGQPDKQDNNSLVYTKTWAVSDAWALFRP